ncbi:MAG TPA: hypothetical protein VHX59_03120 [Mycobacteriales bacterium]|jgi:hypothetical protein|nr:hypothetical protein [Mycobacteriales bacterium]
MGDGGFGAVLFYASRYDPLMRAGGMMTRAKSTKILWWAPGGAGDPLVIHGRELASGRSFSQRADGLGDGQFPSIPDVPSAGRWTLTETANGTVLGAITIPVAAAIPGT